jgi:hypothetical protein
MSVPKVFCGGQQASGVPVRIEEIDTIYRWTARIALQIFLERRSRLTKFAN